MEPAKTAPIPRRSILVSFGSRGTNHRTHMLPPPCLTRTGRLDKRITFALYASQRAGAAPAPVRSEAVLLPTSRRVGHHVPGPFHDGGGWDSQRTLNRPRC